MLGEEDGMALTGPTCGDGGWKVGGVAPHTNTETAHWGEGDAVRQGPWKCMR